MAKALREYPALRAGGHSIAGVFTGASANSETPNEEMTPETAQSLSASRTGAPMEPVAFSAKGETLLSIVPVASRVQTTETHAVF